MDKFTITVDADGKEASWDGETFVGDRAVVADAVRAAETGLPIEVFGLFPVEPDSQTPLGVTASLFAHDPGQTRVTDAPQVVIDWLDEAFTQMDCTHLSQSG